MMACGTPLNLRQHAVGDPLAMGGNTPCGNSQRAHLPSTHTPNERDFRAVGEALQISGGQHGGWGEVVGEICQNLLLFMEVLYYITLPLLLSDSVFKI